MKRNLNGIEKKACLKTLGRKNGIWGRAREKRGGENLTGHGHIDARVIGAHHLGCVRIGAGEEAAKGGLRRDLGVLTQGEKGEGKTAGT